MRKRLATRFDREIWRDTVRYAKALNADGRWSAFECWVDGSQFTRRSIIRAVNVKQGE